MIDILRTIWDFLNHVVATAPPAFWPLIVAMLLSMSFTQWVKFYLPPEWTPRHRNGYTRAIAFLTGVGVTTLLWRSQEGFFCGVIVGCTSPLVYAIAVRRIPILREILSGDP